MSLIEKLITVDCQTADAPSLLSRSKIKTPRCGSLASCSLPYYPSHRLDNHGKQKVHQNQKKVLVLQMRLSQGLVSQSRNLSLLSRSLSRNLSFQQAKLPPVVSPCWQRTRWRCCFAGNVFNMRISILGQIWRRIQDTNIFFSKSSLEHPASPRLWPTLEAWRRKRVGLWVTFSRPWRSTTPGVKVTTHGKKKSSPGRKLNFGRQTISRCAFYF